MRSLLLVPTVPMWTAPKKSLNISVKIWKMMLEKFG